MNKALIVLAVVGWGFAGPVQAVPLVHYDVNLGQNHLGPAAGWFTVTAAVSAGDNFGLASYKITMTGWDALHQYSPKADITDGLFGSESIGFCMFRSASDSTPMTGMQPTVFRNSAEIS